MKVINFAEFYVKHPNIHVFRCSANSVYYKTVVATSCQAPAVQYMHSANISIWLRSMVCDFYLGEEDRRIGYLVS